MTLAAPKLWGLDPVDLEWVRSPVKDRFYRLTAPAGWEEARLAARRLGGDLVPIRDQTEQGWLWETFGPRHLWIGLEDRDRNGSFRWVSGAWSSFTNWCPGEPGGLTRGETVVHLAHYLGWCSGGWNDQDANDRYPGIVERDHPLAPVDVFGRGCRGASAGWLSGQPTPGSTVEIGIVYGDPSPSRRGILLLGLDSERLGSVPLPIDLRTLLGGWLYDCELHLAPLDALDRGPVISSEVFRFRIPPIWAPGTEVFLQGVSVDLAYGIEAVTDAVRIRVVR